MPLGANRRLHFAPLQAALLALALCCLSSCAAGGKVAAEPYPEPDGALDPFAQARALGRGLNLGNFLDATPAEGAWSDGKLIQEAHLDMAAAAGFDSIRLPVRFSGHAGTAPPYTIDPAFLDRVDQVVQWGLARGLRVVIDLHHYEELQLDPGRERRRFVALWEQLATRFRGSPDSVYYELLNEPSHALTVPVWNGLVEETLRAIRRIDRRHTVVIGCVFWSNPSGLEGLQVPAAESNAIVTFHYYTPVLFTFQGQKWIGDDWATTGITWPGPPAGPVSPAPGLSAWARDWIRAYETVRDPERNPGGPGVIREEIAGVAAWGRRNHRPLWMGEFTAQDRADLASRARWLSFVRSELERQGIPRSVWHSDHDASLLDVGSRTWNPTLAEALGITIARPSKPAQ
jgi:endoglucanase